VPEALSVVRTLFRGGCARFVCAITIEPLDTDWNSLASVSVCLGGLQLPNLLRDALLGDLINFSVSRTVANRFPVFHVTVLQHLCVPPKYEKKGALRFYLNVAVFAVSSMSKSGTVPYGQAVQVTPGGIRENCHYQIRSGKISRLYLWL
jgi:hypothetical protein